MKGLLLYPLLIVIAASSYGILSTIVKVAMGAGFTSAEAITSQYVIGFLLAITLFIATQRKLPNMTKEGWKTVIIAGIFTGCTGIVYGESLNYLPASLAVVMLFQFTWIGTFLDCFFKRRLPTRIELISLTILFVGTILSAGVLDTDLSGIHWKGWMFGLLAALSFALTLQYNSRHVDGVTTISRMTIMSFVALVVTSIFLAPEIVWNGTLFTEDLWKYGLLLGTFGIILPILLFAIAAPKVGGAMTSILSAMELPVAVTVSVIVLNEALTMIQVSGIILVLFGMVLPTYLSMKKQPALSKRAS